MLHPHKQTRCQIGTGKNTIRKLSCDKNGKTQTINKILVSAVFSSNPSNLAFKTACPATAGQVLPIRHQSQPEVCYAHVCSRGRIHNLALRRRSDRHMIRPAQGRLLAEKQLLRQLPKARERLRARRVSHGLPHECARPGHYKWRRQ